jgi:hypothetical protein
VQGAAAPASDPGPGGLFIEPPRTYGVRLQYDFGGR